MRNSICCPPKPPVHINFLNRFFDEDFIKTTFNNHNLHHSTKVNISETETSYDIEVFAAGFAKEAFKINVEKDILTISAEKKVTESKTTKKYIRQEFSFKSFKRSFQVPENVNVENIVAEYESGILTVSLPKSEPAKPKTTTIEIA
ncbi:MAG: Hsp20/alpha crystallin family protein [Chitinophagales bacterium]